MSCVPIGDVAAAGDGDPILTWTAQAMREGVRAWRLGEAVAVACPDLSERDRLTVRGAPGADLAALVRHAMGEVGPQYRIMADTEVADWLVGAMPGLEPVHAFGWMDLVVPPVVEPERPGSPAAEWLGPDDDPAVLELLLAAFPTSHAMPGHGGAGAGQACGIRATRRP